MPSIKRPGILARTDNPDKIMNPDANRRIKTIDAYVENKITEQLIPGAVVLISSRGQIIHEAAYGFSQLFYLDKLLFSATDQPYPKKIAAGIKPLALPQRMMTDQVFDMASVTKVLATAFAIMLLLEAERLTLNDPLKLYLPEFNTEDKRDITIDQLITHCGGFIPWIPLYYYAENRKDAIAYIAQYPLSYPPGTKTLYSDLNYLILGYLIEQITGESLDSFIYTHLFKPLNLSRTTFNPDPNKLNLVATSHGNPYEYHLIASNKFGSKQPEDVRKFTKWRDYTLVGEVNDGNAFHAFQGIAGHSGLFATATEVNTLLELINQRGYFNNISIINRHIIDHLVDSGTLNFCLGWKTLNHEYYSILSQTDWADERMIGHSGFSGTWVACFPNKGFNLILLTNRQNLGLNKAGTYNDLFEFKKEILRLGLIFSQ